MRFSHMWCYNYKNTPLTDADPRKHVRQLKYQHLASPTDYGTLHVESSDDSSALIGKEANCGVRTCFVIICVILIRFGDATELYLPGVIIQQIACDLGISRTAEGILAISMYVLEFVAVVASYFIAENFGRRPVLLFSLYISIAATILSSVIPNYSMLLLYRCVVGAAVGLNESIIGVYSSELLMDKKMGVFGSFMQLSALSVGAGYINIFGYFYLDKMGWRWFILFTSIPAFLLPIFLIHFCLPETQTKRQFAKTITQIKKQFGKSNSVLMSEASLTRKQRIILTAKLSAMFFVTAFQSKGLIMLLPDLIRLDNIENNDVRKDCFAVKGQEFLEIAVITGGCNVLGRVLGFVVRDKVSLRTTIRTTSITTFTIFAIMLLFDNLWVYEVLLGIITVVTAIEIVKMTVVQYDIRIFGGAMALTSTLISSFSLVAVILGNASPEFSSSFRTFLSCIFLSVVKGFVSCSVDKNI